MTLITTNNKLISVSVSFYELERLFLTSIIARQSGESIKYRFLDGPTGRTFDVNEILITIHSFPTANNGAPDVLLHRLPEFFRLFLSDGLLPDLVYALGLNNA